MKHRFIARLFACLLAILLPVSAFAENPVLDLLSNAKEDGKEVVATLTFTPGSALSATAAIADLGKALALSLTAQPTGLAQVALSLDGTDVITTQVRAGSDGVYIHSDAISNDTLYFSVDDVQMLMQRMIESSGASSSAAAQMMSSFSQGFSQGFSTSMTARQNLTGDAPTTPEEFEAALTEAMGGDASLANWIKELRERTVTTTGEFASDDHDTADTKTELTLTQDDFAKMFDMPFIQKNITTQYQNRGMTEAEATAAMEKAVVQIKDELAKQVITVPITGLSIGDSELVCMDIPVTATYTYNVTIEKSVEGTAEATAAPADATAAPADATVPVTETVTETRVANISMPMHFDRKTTDAGVAYHATAQALKEDELYVSIDVSASKDSAGALAATLQMSKDGKTPLSVITASYAPNGNQATGELCMDVYDDSTKNTAGVVFPFTRTVSENTAELSIGMGFGKSVAEIKAANDSLLTLNLRLDVREPSALFAAMQAATPETSVRLSQMTTEEINTFSTTMSTNALQALYTLLGKLPASVIELFGGTVSGN